MTKQTPPEYFWIIISPSGEMKCCTRYQIVAKWNKQRGDKMFRYKRAPRKKRLPSP